MSNPSTGPSRKWRAVCWRDDSLRLHLIDHQPQMAFGEPSPGVMKTGTEFTVQLPIAAGQLHARRTYVLETFALKHLPGLEFSPGDWRTSPESWRVRDNPTYMLIVVPAGME